MMEHTRPATMPATQTTFSIVSGNCSAFRASGGGGNEETGLESTRRDGVKCVGVLKATHHLMIDWDKEKTET